MGKQAFMNKKKLFTGNLGIELKKSVLCSMHQKHADRKRLEAMEMWIWRTMGKISWVDKMSNEEVLQRVNKNRHGQKTQTCG